MHAAEHWPGTAMHQPIRCAPHGIGNLDVRLHDMWVRAFLAKQMLQNKVVPVVGVD